MSWLHLAAPVMTLGAGWLAWRGAKSAQLLATMAHNAAGHFRPGLLPETPPEAVLRVLVLRYLIAQHLQGLLAVALAVAAGFVWGRAL